MHGNSEGRGVGVQKQAISKGVEGDLSSLFSGGSGKIDEKAISYFTVNRGFKANIIVFHR